LPSRWVNWLATLLRIEFAEPNENSAPAVPYGLSASELVTRFIYSERRMNKLRTRPMPDSFYPPADGELSVVHSTGLPDHEVWEIGRTHALGDQPGRDRIRGRADVPVKALIDRKLSAIRDDNPFKRHTSVIGWPTSDDADQQKQQRTGICLELSQDPDVKLIIPESPIVHTA